MLKLAAAMTALLSTAASAAEPDRQLSFQQTGILIKMAGISADQRGIAMTLTLVNSGDTPLHFAALFGRTATGVAQAVLSNDKGASCTADANPSGIALITHLVQNPKPPVNTMTLIPPRSRMNSVFRFKNCRIEGPLAFSGEFALSTGRDPVLISVPFWGIEAP